MTFEQLVSYLERQFAHPQPSERWAMYRLINPVIDFANQEMGFTPYFEYNQTSEHGTHQSVDIALLDGGSEPRVFIEAKRADRKVSPEQIEKYLEPSDRGVVSNGYLWILCVDGKHEPIRVFSNQLDASSLKKVIEFINGSFDIDGKQSTAADVYSSSVRPPKVVNKAPITRPMHEVTEVKSQTELDAFIVSKSDRPANEVALLQAVAGALADHDLPHAMRIETRKTRISFFDEHRSRNEKRLARIELGKAQPDLLVRTWVVEQHPELTQIASATVHDKGAHMRRFRLGTKQQSEEFGKALVGVLKQSCAQG
jgi:hypothetical protein